MRGIMGIVLAIGAQLLACGADSTSTCEVDGEDLVRRLDHAVSTGSAIVDLPDVASFAWDRVFVFNEYSPARKIKSATGFDYAPDLIRNHVPEGMDLIVFVSNGEPTCHLVVPDGRRGGVEWAFYGSAFRNEGVATSEAHFKIDRSERIPRLIPVDLPEAREAQGQ